MKKIYTQMLKIAQPYLKRSRPYDYIHVKTLLKFCPEIIKRDKLDEAIIIPAVIFHDIGWSKISNKDKLLYRNKKLRLLHMKYGSEIAKRQLTKLHYDKNKIKTICRLISVHDYPSLGKNLTSKNEFALASLDYLWRVTKISFTKDLKETQAKPAKLLIDIKTKAKERHIFKFNQSAYSQFKILYQKRLKEIKGGQIS